MNSNQTPTTNVNNPTAETALFAKKTPLTDRQWERLAFGLAASIVQQGIDNGIHTDGEIDLTEWTPSGFDPSFDLDEDELTAFSEELGVRLGRVVSDMEEEAAKRD